MIYRQSHVLLPLMALLAVALLVGCADEDGIIREAPGDDAVVQLEGCIGCHSNSEYLLEQIGVGDGGGGSGEG